MPTRSRKTKTTRRKATRPSLSIPAPLLPPKGRTDHGVQPGYYRFPAIHGDQIVFCSDDDLWSVGIEGGIARRLTVSRTHVARPIFSPDGSRIAFTSADEGGGEIYLVDASGGEPQRLTFTGSVTMATVGWSPDGREVICATDFSSAFAGDLRLAAVDVRTGHIRPLDLGPALNATWESDGPGMAIARNGMDPARWKRYRGGTVGTIWIDRQGKGNFRRILGALPGNVASPMWIGKRIYFLSDHEGIGNLYSCRPTGEDVQRHTDHTEFYARFASRGGSRIVYHTGADLHLYDTATRQGGPVPIEIRSPRPQRQRRFVSGAEGMEDFDIHPRGHSLALTVRGRPVTMGFWEGPATEFCTPWQGRHRLARWLNDGKRMVAITDEKGEEELEIITPGKGAEVIALDQDLGRVVDLSVAPAPPKRRTTKKKAPRPRAHTDRIALTNQRQEVIIVDLTRRRAKVIDRSGYDRIAGLSWSPDGRWLAYGIAVGLRNRAIRVARVTTGAVRQITTGDFLDFNPCFDPEGKYLYFLSLRTYDPVYDLIQFNLGFPRGVRPCLVTLRQDTLSPFLPGPRPLGGKPEGHAYGSNPWEVEEKTEALASAAPAVKKKPTAAPVEIDFDGIESRVLAFPIPEGRYDDLQASPGKVFLRAQPIEGSLGAFWLDANPPANASIEVYDLTELRSSTFVGGVSEFRIGQDGKTLVYRSGRRLRALSAATEPGKLPSGDDPGRRSGWIRLDRVRCSVQPADEWRQMLAEAWRLQRDQFWVPDLQQVDWVKIYQRYLPLVDRISTRGEMSDLIWEMQGELGTSHAYEFGGDYRRPPTYPIGRLGADLTFDRRQKRWKVTHIPQGDSWDGAQASPLAAPGLGIVPGTVIHAVNGQQVGRDLTPMECLVHRADQEIWLTVSDPARKGQQSKPRTVTIKTLRTEFPLRYRDWVEQNRAWVHAQSKGNVGYLHIPNMGPLGYSEFHRYFLAELHYPGLIVDVRHNGGGHVSQLLLDKLRRQRIGYDVTRYGQPEPYPAESPRGPMVAITDEWAGSDGDIFSHSWKIYGLGPLIGKRTWGGVIGVWPRHRLVDG